MDAGTKFIIWCITLVVLMLAEGLCHILKDIQGDAELSLRSIVFLILLGCILFFIPSA